MSTLGVKTFMSCSYVHEIRNHVHIMGLQNRCKEQLFLWKIGGLRTLAPHYIYTYINFMCPFLMNFWARVKGKGTTIFHAYLLQGTQEFPMNVEDEGS